MPRKLTNEEFIERLGTLRSDIRALDLYIDMNTKIRFQCHKGHIWSAQPHLIIRGSGCPYCAGRHKTLSSIQQSLNEMGSGIIIKEYIDMKTKALFQCEKGHRWRAKPGYVLQGSGCPYCANKKILIGFNDVWTTHPQVAQLLKNANDGYTHTYGSGDKLEFICPDCKSVVMQTLHNVQRMGLICSHCADSISYPNKFSRALLKLLPVAKVQHEWQPDWLKPYLYDNYFEYENQKYVLEMDGGLGHGHKDRSRQAKDIQGLRNDQLKDSLASQHNIIVIRIDCDYHTENRFEYIKDNICNSLLNQLFNLSDIDWQWCDAQGLRKMVKEVAALYNQGLSVKHICQQVQHNWSTVARWLRQARALGICNYNESESRIRGGRTITRHNIAVNQYTLDGRYVNTYISMAEATRKLGLTGGNISTCCGNSNRSTGGFKWYKATDVNQPDKSKILYTIQND